MKTWAILWCMLSSLFLCAEEVEIGMRLRTESVFAAFSEELEQQAWGFTNWQRAMSEQGIVRISRSDRARYFGLAKIQEITAWQCTLAAKAGDKEPLAWLVEVKICLFIWDVKNQQEVVRATVSGFAATLAEGASLPDIGLVMRMLGNAFVESSRCAKAETIARLLPGPLGQKLLSESPQMMERKQREMAKVEAATGRKPLRRTKLDWQRMQKPKLCEQYRTWLPTPPDNKAMKISVALDQPSVRVEQPIGFSFTAGDRGFVYLLNIVESGQMQLLLPLVGYKKQPPNHVQAASYRYPPDDAEFPFEASAFVAQHAGQELFVALLTERPIKAIEQAVERAWGHAKVREAKGEDYDNLVPLTAHEVEQAREEIKQGRWGWAIAELTIREK